MEHRYRVQFLRRSQITNAIVYQHMFDFCTLADAEQFAMRESERGSYPGSVHDLETGHVTKACDCWDWLNEKKVDWIKEGF